ncbi:hypothetical protein [Halonotius sp. GCM10025705]|uniref:hypothetical protein n=1 Tax=Halonotius sp. GCM10025705 TaxID=3252678 RepID=UPI0036213C30
MKQSFNRAADTEARLEHRDSTDESAREKPSPSVEWNDITEKRAATAPMESKSGSTTVSDRIQSRSGSSIIIETGLLTVTLVGVPKVSITDLVYAHHRDVVAESEETRFCAMFDIENTSNMPIQWRSQRTTFIGTDGYTYEKAHVALDSAALAPGCHTNHVIVQPGCRARIVTPVEQLPQGIEVAKVVHTVSPRTTEPNQRLNFTL